MAGFFLEFQNLFSGTVQKRACYIDIGFTKICKCTCS